MTQQKNKLHILVQM